MKFILLSFLIAPTLIACVRAAPLNDFELCDQFGSSRAYRFPKSMITVITVADQRGSEQLEPWISHIYQRFGKRIHIDGIADLSSVPKPLRGAVRFFFRSRLSHSVLMDWDGTVVKQFSPRAGAANIYVVDHGGRIVARTAGRLNRVALADISCSIEHTMEKL